MICDVEAGASIKYTVLAYISTIVDRYKHLNFNKDVNDMLEEKNSKITIKSTVDASKDNLRVIEFENIDEDLELPDYDDF